MAARLFSHHPAQALKYILHKNAEGTFIELVNDTFDVLNSRVLEDKVNSPTKWIWYGYFKAGKCIKEVP